jgi:hypothetical protein
MSIYIPNSTKDAWDHYELPDGELSHIVIGLSESDERRVWAFDKDNKQHNGKLIERDLVPMS